MALSEAWDRVYGTEEAVPVATLLELLPEYVAVDGCSRASVVRYSLVAREPLFVDDFPAFVDCVLLVDDEQGNQGIGDVEDQVPRDNQGVSLLHVIYQAILKEQLVALCDLVVAKR